MRTKAWATQVNMDRQDHIKPKSFCKAEKNDQQSKKKKKWEKYLWNIHLIRDSNIKHIRNFKNSVAKNKKPD